MTIWQASRPTVIGSGIRRKAFWNKVFKFLVLGRVEDLIEASDAVRSLPFHSSVLFKFLVLGRVEDLIEASDAVLSLPFHSSVCFAMRLQKFSCFCSKLPFRVFTLESFFPFHFHFFIIFFDCPIMHLTIQNSSRTSERLIKIFCWLRKRDNSLVDYEKFLKE